MTESIRTVWLSTGLSTVGHCWIWFFSSLRQAGRAGFPWICFGSWRSAARFSSSHKSIGSVLHINQDHLAYIFMRQQIYFEVWKGSGSWRVLVHEEFWYMKGSGSWIVLGVLFLFVGGTQTLVLIKHHKHLDLLQWNQNEPRHQNTFHLRPASDERLQVRLGEDPVLQR